VVKRFTLEMRHGIEQAGKRRDQLVEYELPNWFGDRVLTVDRRVADRWDDCWVSWAGLCPALTVFSPPPRCIMSCGW
jgi:hypothetical protein